MKKHVKLTQQILKIERECVTLKVQLSDNRIFYVFDKLVAELNHFCVSREVDKGNRTELFCNEFTEPGETRDSLSQTS